LGSKGKLAGLAQILATPAPRPARYSLKFFYLAGRLLKVFHGGLKNTMKRRFAVVTLALFSSFGLAAQGRGRGQAHQPISSPAQTHSNAPAGTPAASADRDRGKDRAEDVGQGKQKGLKKVHKSKKQQKATS